MCLENRKLESQGIGILNAFAEMFPLILESIRPSIRVTVEQITKNNGVILTGIKIAKQGSRIAPLIYLNSFYEAYKEGWEIGRIIQQILYVYDNNLPNIILPKDCDINFDNIKDRLFYKLIGYEKNQMLDLWGNTLAEIFQIAHENTRRIYPAKVCNINDIIRECLPELSGEQTEIGLHMYVATNTPAFCGAAVILYDNLLKDFSQTIDDDFYVLPSSLHEVIFVPSKSVGITVEEMSQQVKVINQTEVNTVDILSDSVYLYSRDRDCLERVA